MSAQGLRVAVLMGGGSGERAVSLASGSQVTRALRARGHSVLMVDTARGILSPEDEAHLLAELEIGGPARSGVDPGDLLATGGVLRMARELRAAGTDIIFPALHGGAGEDGTLQTLLELAQVPFAGSDRVGCTLSMDKEISKRLFREAGIPTPEWLMAPQEPEAVIRALGLPLIVKPARGGSTLGLTLVHRAEEIQEAVEEAQKWEPRVMFEGYIQGREVTVGILGDRALPVGEIIPTHEIFDYECKYKPGLAEEIFPAQLELAQVALLQEMALAIHRTLHLKGFSRIDFILDEEGVPWCLEANALPGLTSSSLFPQAALAAGMDLGEVVEAVILGALGRNPAPAPGLNPLRLSS
ncbi:MAG: D-alanine--D-alanine ligase [Gemmatimonadota bacterium]